MKCYLVELNTGDAYDMSWKSLFVTNNEYKAKFYCSRGNEILGFYKDHYAQKRTEIEASEDYILINHIMDREDFCKGTFVYSEMEFRDNIKIKDL